MSANTPAVQHIHGYCALCISRCGAVAVIEDGRFVALEPDPAHPTGKALCAKGRAAPELVYHPDRLLYPLKRTRPKGDPDPGWQRISWDEALDTIATRLKQIAAEHGPESVVFSVVSPSTSASDDSTVWIQRLMNAFGSPNLCASMELCGWGRYQATTYTFGTSVPGIYMPDLERAGCILFWGYNPNLARLSHATATLEALKRGARLIVVDPRRTGIAKKADVWLQVRPGTDGALALGLAHIMLERGWYDHEFIRHWTNGPLLVRLDNGHLLTQADLSIEGGAKHYVAWNDILGQPMSYDPAHGYEVIPLKSRSSAPSTSKPYTARSNVSPPSNAWPSCAGVIRPNASKPSATFHVINWNPPRVCCGKRGPSPTMRGAASRCTPTPLRSPAPSRSSLS